MEEHPVCATSQSNACGHDEELDKIPATLSDYPRLSDQDDNQITEGAQRNQYIQPLDRGTRAENGLKEKGCHNLVRIRKRFLRNWSKSLDERP